MAVTYLVVAYGGSHYGQIPYASIDTDSLVPAETFTASYVPTSVLEARYTPIVALIGKAR